MNMLNSKIVAGCLHVVDTSCKAVTAFFHDGIADLRSSRTGLLVLQSLCVGALVGLFVGAFRLSVAKGFAFAMGWVAQMTPVQGVAEFERLWPSWILGGILLTLAACAVGRMVMRNPLIGGSGIPHVEAYLEGRLPFAWVPVLVCKTLGTWLVLVAGFSVGREGPCIQIGTALGLGMERLFREFNKKFQNIIAITGSAAGLAAAFGAPLGGIAFVFEEMRCALTLRLVLCVGCAAFSANVTLAEVFGLGQMFPFDRFAPPAFEHLGIIVGLGVVVGGLGAVYNATLIKFTEYYTRLYAPHVQWVFTKPLVPFIGAALLAFYMPSVLGGGDALILSLPDNLTALQNTPLQQILQGLLVVLGFKFAFSMLCSSSGVPGGLLMPLLCLGALTGQAYGLLMLQWGQLTEPEVACCLVLGMTGLFAGIVRAPLTGFLLTLEMTGSYACLPWMLMVTFIANSVADALRAPPVYASLKDRLLRSFGI